MKSTVTAAMLVLIAVSSFALGYITQLTSLNSIMNEATSLQNQLQSKEQQYTTLQQQYAALEQQYSTLQQQRNTLQQEYDILSGNFESLKRSYDTLSGSYSALNINYLDLLAEFKGSLNPPYTTIRGGNVTWVFRTIDETVQEWYMPLETYAYYAERSKPTEYHSLTTDGQTFRVRNMELFVQPDFFSDVIDNLSYGNTASEFVREVFNLRMQLTVYSADITDTPQWSAETMTKGTGDCEDFAILMASLLLAGNQEAHYGMKVQMVYMDSDHPTDPQGVNHVLLYVSYKDGTGEFVDSTLVTEPSPWADLSPWSDVTGWYYAL